jgi:hypothetical protein
MKRKNSQMPCSSKKTKPLKRRPVVPDEVPIILSEADSIALISSKVDRPSSPCPLLG